MTLKEGVDADKVVSKHIKLLHRYNEAKDAAQVRRLPAWIKKRHAAGDSANTRSRFHICKWALARTKSPTAVSSTDGADFALHQHLRLMPLVYHRPARPMERRVTTQRASPVMQGFRRVPADECKSE